MDERLLQPSQCNQMPICTAEMLAWNRDRCFPDVFLASCPFRLPHKSFLVICVVVDCAKC